MGTITDKSSLQAQSVGKTWARAATRGNPRAPIRSMSGLAAQDGKAMNNNEAAQADAVTSDFFTIEELSRYLGMTVWSVRGLRTRGTLPPAFKIGRTLKWRRSEIEDWLESQREVG